MGEHFSIRTGAAVQSLLLWSAVLALQGLSQLCLQVLDFFLMLALLQFKGLPLSGQSHFMLFGERLQLQLALPLHLFPALRVIHWVFGQFDMRAGVFLTLEGEGVWETATTGSRTWQK